MPFASSAPDTSNTNGTTYLRNRRFRVQGASQRLSASTARAYRSRGASLDELIRTQQQRLRNREAERLGGLEVGAQLVLGRWLHGKVPRTGPAEDLVNVDCRTAKLFAQPNRIGHERPCFCGLAGGAHRG